MEEARARSAVAPTAGRDIDFLIVGSSRSGTTLVQRLACELPGIRMPPETHFFWRFAPRVLERRRFPLDARALQEELEAYAGLHSSRQLDLDLEAIREALGNRCDSLLELFRAIVVHLAGEGILLGEKTPEHLLWWRPLSRALPGLKFIAVVRDPRAVVTSLMTVPWGKKWHVVHAERWRSDQRQVTEAVPRLGTDRFLVVRYEDVVTDPASTRSLLAGFLGVRAALEGSFQQAAPSIVLPRESWKQSALGPITTARVNAWRDELTSCQIADINAICRREMKVFGYGEGVPGPLAAAARLSRLGLEAQLRRTHFRWTRRRQLATISRVVL